MQSPLQEMLEAIDDLVAIAMLTAGGLGVEVKDTAGVDVGLELGKNSGPLSIGQACGIRHVEGQFDLCGGSIDVLPPRAPTATELEMQLCEGDFKRFRDFERGIISHRSPASEAGAMPRRPCLSHSFSACLFGVPQVRCHQCSAPMCEVLSGAVPVHRRSPVVYRL